MIGGLLRYLVGRRLLRFLPGGWLWFLLMSPWVRHRATRAFLSLRNRG